MASMKKKMGGARPGAGRKKVIPGETKCFSTSLGENHQAAVKRIMKEQKIASGSEVLRYLIEQHASYEGEPTVATGS